MMQFNMHLCDLKMELGGRSSPGTKKERGNVYVRPWYSIVSQRGRKQIKIVLNPSCLKKECLKQAGSHAYFCLLA